MFLETFRVFRALMARELIVIAQELRPTFIDCAFLVTTEILLFSKFLPLMGMPAQDGPALFIGSSYLIAILICYTHAQNLLFDLEFSKFIDYQITQPITIPWIMVKYIITMAIQAMLVSIPLLAMGSFAFSTPLFSTATQWPIAVALYVASCICTATLFLFFSFHYPFIWFMDNIWARRLSPIFGFGSLFLLWKKVYALSPIAGVVFLANPFTYMAEGLRSALLGTNQFIPAPICLLALIGFIILLSGLLLRAIKIKLDPV